jgi:hypothetical protein
LVVTIFVFVFGMLRMLALIICVPVPWLVAASNTDKRNGDDELSFAIVNFHSTLLHEKDLLRPGFWLQSCQESSDESLTTWCQVRTTHIN